ncbi:nucleoporin p58/p45-like isoform X2 [Mizuhopecten yessoensis]|uniref:nucleoporin p58/p45-like isoform X2 n=1 Tax=Mizuhopecten yessoensis TaxID=6573 RepID=UPI000B457892|nr:nucleoporin p58/p45-like isoform X2 [Mizuhopecten yessoensis]
MNTGGGFNFKGFGTPASGAPGATAATAATPTFGTAAPATGLTFGGSGATPSLGGLAGAAASPLAGFGTPASTKPPSLLSQTLGTNATKSTGFSFGGAATPATSTAAPSLLGTPGGLLGSAASGGIGTGTLGGTPGTLGSPGLFGTATAAKTQVNTGFSLSASATTVGATGLTLPGAKPNTATAASTGSQSTGFSFAAKVTTPAATTGSTAAGFGSLGTAGLGGKMPTGLGVGATAGLGGGATTGLGGTGTSVFSNISTKPQTTGLGGVDPKTSQAAAGGTATDAKPGDGKALKKTFIPEAIVLTVEDFKKYVKEEKSVQDGLARMSSKPMYKVQEDVMALKQLLSVVSNGVQRNTCAVEKLKREMTQELKHAEMAQRTKDIPPGLQYENTAPTEYFQHLVEDFEHQMLLYRQQIETLEGHLASLHQPSKLSPEELIVLMRKLHEAFIALAAQLHHVHEAVKTQKDHYLNYRKIYLHDGKNIFDREKKATSKAHLHPVTQMGPSPFSDMSNAAAIAMASALSRSQQPTAGPPVAGLTGTGGFFTNTTTTPATGFGFGTNTVTQSSTVPGFGLGTSTSSSFGLLGSKGFGTAATAVAPSGIGGSLFGGSSFGGSNTTGMGGTATVRPLGFGITPQPLGGSSGFNLSTTQQTPGLTFGNTPAFGVAAPNAEAPFQLNKPPPPGSKRGKR